MSNKYFRQKTKNISDASGMALVTALLILSLIMVSSLAFAKIIMSEVRMSANIINSVGSFYAANGGMEKALHHLKYAYRFSYFDEFRSLESQTEAFSIGAGQTFKIIESQMKHENFIAYNITTTTAAYVDIIDPAGSVGGIDWVEEQPEVFQTRYELIWQVKNCFPYHASDRLEINFNSFAQNFTNFESRKDLAVCNCAFGSDECQPVIYDISPNRYYRFSFRPLNNAVERLEMRIIDQDNNNLGIFSRTAMTVDGIYRNSRYRLKAVMPAIAPVSGVFSYVIFSEEPFIKDPIW